MKFLDKLLGLEPDAVVPVTSNVNNNIYINPDQIGEFDLYQNLTKFIAKEFTKVNINVDKNIPNSNKLDYILNLKPNNNQTANDLLYIFAFSMLKSGRVFYKVSSNDRALTSVQFSNVQAPGFKMFEKTYLRIKKPVKLLSQYADLLANLSTTHTTNAIEIKTKLKANDENVSESVKNRLIEVNKELHDYGAFLTQTDETANDHNNIVQPDGTALNDLRALILEEYNINESILTGKYTEQDYRAFYATHIQPLSNALEELLNFELVPYASFTSNNRINVILDLLQFATLESFTQLAQQGIYNGYLNADEVRNTLGKEPITNGIGSIYYSNANAVRLNNPDGTLYDASSNTNKNQKDTSGDDDNEK